jgi:hypothetical protein
MADKLAAPLNIRMRTNSMTSVAQCNGTVNIRAMHYV